MKCIKQPIFALGLFVLSSRPILVQGQVRIRKGADRVIGEITPESVSSPESERRKLPKIQVQEVSCRVKL